ncbi:competence protein CoiA [Paenibacillus agaridevorans]|uniref:competence protein CoiA n=1 Tax=Paenibacillus agaridevorans TaxID=171404 RepID=UPI001BE49D63|nr:competence protein CoiA family protein [Paenibacillus agaridevorans]
MFVAEDINGKRYYAFEEAEDFIRTLSQNRSLICPDCRDRVTFRSGSKRPHFAHFRECTNPNMYSEPETQAHHSGKLLLFLWLKKQFPELIVEMEYYIPETRQRSDIIVLHPDGNKWAIEFQCSKIQGHIWEERHKLYQSEGIHDIWIVNHEIVRRNVHEMRLCGLESSVHRSTNILNYLNINEQSIHMIVNGRLDGLYLYRSHESRSILEDVTIHNGRLWSKSYEDFLAEMKKLREIQELKEKENLLKSQLENERVQLENEKRNRDLVHYYKAIMIERMNLSNDMTQKENELFLALTKKHKLEPNNFPGIFHMDVRFSDRIVTPRPLWQLWIYDALVSNWENFIRKGKPPRLWMEYITENFKKLRTIGILRTAKFNQYDGNYIFTFYSYLEQLNHCGILQSLGSMTTKYQQLLVNRIPMFEKP